jgi:hypothetical protein
MRQTRRVSCKRPRELKTRGTDMTLRVIVLSTAVVLSALLSATAQQQTEPPVLPAGKFCEHQMKGAAAPAHPCNCQRECLPNVEVGSDGKPHETVTVKEDPQCKQWCHAEHCHCPMKNCP